ncbi:hypothetical protein KVV02_001024 [Mortierella alpina]|uniref:BAG domain-containing protein n=1 Tax=Mortierella alpina TaxID=64518 RepID=A0A9P8A7D9_MORAP|nr:hypothetical protein KVV02_001024 [Mortierella alpina]
MAPAPARARRSTTSATIPSSVSPPPTGPPPPPPPGHPNLPVHSFSFSGNPSSKRRTQHDRQDQRPDARTSVVSLRINPSRQSSPSIGHESEPQQENWRSIFDGALVKAQQAVQLDELGEATLAANLYAQAANDLGRVIPMCGSEKKKQSMLAIQAIYLDRVLQLKAIAPSSSKSTRSASPASISAPSQPQGSTRQSAASHRRSQSHGRGSRSSRALVYGHESQEPYQPPPPPPPQLPQQSIMKRSKTQPPAQDSSIAKATGDHSHSSQGEYNHDMNGDTVNSSFGYISPPSSTTARSPSPPPMVVSPIAMAQNSPVTLPLANEQDENSAALGKSSRWKPFGKKKSKSFSTGETSSSSNPEAIHLPAPLPTGSQHTPLHLANIVDPADHADAYSQQQQADWMVGQYFDENNGPLALNDYDQHTPMYDEDDSGEAEVFYFADSKGHARTTEAKENDKGKNNEKSKKKSRSKSSQNDSASAHPSEHHVQDRTLQSEGPIYASNTLETYGDAYMSEAQEPYQQNSFDPMHQFQHSGYSRDPSVMLPQSTKQDAHENEGAKPKGKWFGKKKLKEGQTETFDDVAKIMEEALFGGGSSVSRKKNKETKGKQKDKGGDTHSSQAVPVISKRKDSLTEYSGSIEHTHLEQSSGTDVGYLDDQQRYYSEGLQFQQPESRQFVADATNIYAPAPFTLQAPPTPNALAPIAYSPRTTYTPSPKKNLQKEGTFATSIVAPAEAYEQHPLSSEVAVTSDSTALEAIENSSTKKTKTRPFNLFKGKKNSGKTSLEHGGGQLSPTFNIVSESDKTRKGSIQSSDRKATDTALPATQAKDDKKKRCSDDYVPYEYQEEVEGPLMERVEVPQNREVVGFVMPIEEGNHYNTDNNEEPSVDNWDSWVSQLESFEKVLSDNGLEKEKAKRPKKVAEKETAQQVLISRFPPGASPGTSVAANRASMFSNGTSLGRHSTSTYDLNDNRSAGLNEDSIRYAHRHSFQSSRSSAVIGQDTTVQQFSFQQAQKRWWNPARKEAISLYSTRESVSVSEYEQERYLSTLLHKADEQPAQEQEQEGQEQGSNQRVDGSSESREREEALSALFENSRTVMSLPPRQATPSNSSTVTTQELSCASSIQEDSTEQSQGPAHEEEEPVVAPLVKVKSKSKSSKPKLLPISTPLAQLLKLSNPDELWQYVQQAKTYATTRMNKGDKRSAAIALKRAQTLEARWQEVLLEMASSEEDDDELLDDDDDEEDEASGSTEEEQEEEQEGQDDGKTQKSKIAANAAVTGKLNEATLATINANRKGPPTTPVPASIQGTEDGEEEEEEGEQEGGDEEEDRRRMVQARKVTSRSDNALDMYSKYKNKGDKTEGDKHGAPSTDQDDRDDGRLDAEATLQQMVSSDNVAHLKFYIQRLKTDTVAKARNGSKFAALEGMKNVKVLQQRLDHLEGNGQEEQTVQMEETQETEGGADDRREAKTMPAVVDAAQTKEATMYSFFGEPRDTHRSRRRQDRQDFFPSFSNPLFYDPFSQQGRSTSQGDYGMEDPELYADHRLKPQIQRPQHQRPQHHQQQHLRQQEEQRRRASWEQQQRHNGDDDKDDMQSLVESAFGEETMQSDSPGQVPKLKVTSASQYEDDSDEASDHIGSDQDNSATEEYSADEEESIQPDPEQQQKSLVELHEIECSLQELSQELHKILSGEISNKRHILLTEENLTKAMLRIDAVESGGDDAVRKQRKGLIDKAERLLEKVDEYKHRTKTCALNRSH